MAATGPDSCDLKMCGVSFAQNALPHPQQSDAALAALIARYSDTCARSPRCAHSTARSILPAIRWSALTTYATTALLISKGVSVRDTCGAIHVGNPFSKKWDLAD